MRIFEVLLGLVIIGSGVYLQHRPKVDSLARERKKVIALLQELQCAALTHRAEIDLHCHKESKGMRCVVKSDEPTKLIRKGKRKFPGVWFLANGKEINCLTIDEEGGIYLEGDQVLEISLEEVNTGLRCSLNLQAPLDPRSDRLELKIPTKPDCRCISDSDLRDAQLTNANRYLGIVAL